MFKVGDKIIIRNDKDNLYYICGIINHPTEKLKKDVFDGLILDTSSFWKNELKGSIYLIGKDNHYIIISGNDYYVFTNDYNEMELIR
jgi:hypothetical protein